MSKALVILSGGQDSTTCLYWAKQRFSTVYALTIDYGQRHAREIESARKIAALAAVPQEVLKIGGLFAGDSPLTNIDKNVERYDSAEKLPGGLENTFVPARNILFLSLAANRAYVLGCQAIIIGVGQEDFGGYPDCRQEFIERMQIAISSGLDRSIELIAPLMFLNKGECVKLAQALPGCIDALAHSTTCYNGDFPPCGHCHSCLLRARGFAQAGIADPLLERTAPAGAQAR